MDLGSTGEIMIINGYVKSYKYSGDGTLLVQVRVPQIHGPMDPKEAKGNLIRTYVRDENLPYYPSLLLPHLPAEGEVVALITKNEKTTDLMVLGLTGGSYYNNYMSQV